LDKIHSIRLAVASPYSTADAAAVIIRYHRATMVTELGGCENMLLLLSSTSPWHLGHGAKNASCALRWEDLGQPLWYLA
jgi:hypothetical protein